MWLELCMSRLISLKTMIIKAWFHRKTYNRAVINIKSSTVEGVKTGLLIKGLSFVSLLVYHPPTKRKFQAYEGIFLIMDVRVYGKRPAFST